MQTMIQMATMQITIYNHKSYRLFTKQLRENNAQLKL